ncbi:hypothetical protein H311_01948 [Anncaliia algerae PRA109]|nr:hypothetical protein H311_01948 [Anncaliia algerae PRA109]
MLKKLLRIILYWSDNLQQKVILRKLNISYTVYIKTVNKIINKINEIYTQNPIRLRGFDNLVEIDETMLNYKIKSEVEDRPVTKLMHYV